MPIRTDLPELTLIYGPPATGKTPLAKTLAERLDLTGSDPAILDNEPDNEAIWSAMARKHRYGPTTHVIAVMQREPTPYLREHATVIVCTQRQEAAA